MHSESRTDRFNTTAAAAFLGLSPRTLENLRVSGGGPKFLKVRRRVYYRRETLEAYLARCERESTSDVGPRAA